MRSILTRLGVGIALGGHLIVLGISVGMAPIKAGSTCVTDIKNVLNDPSGACLDRRNSIDVLQSHCCMSTFRSVSLIVSRVWKLIKNKKQTCFLLCYRTYLKKQYSNGVRASSVTMPRTFTTQTGVFCRIRNNQIYCK